MCTTFVMRIIRVWYICHSLVQTMTLGWQMYQIDRVSTLGWREVVVWSSWWCSDVPTWVRFDFRVSDFENLGIVTWNLVFSNPRAPTLHPSTSTHIRCPVLHPSLRLLKWAFHSTLIRISLNSHRISVDSHPRFSRLSFAFQLILHPHFTQLSFAYYENSVCSWREICLIITDISLKHISSTSLYILLTSAWSSPTISWLS